VILLTGAFGLRCSEALTLKREDICLDAEVPKIKIVGDTVGARKSPGDVYVRQQHLKIMKDHLKNGIQVVRVTGHKHGKGKKKLISKKDVFLVPRHGYIFKARKNAKDAHLHYHAVYDHVVRQAPKFYQHLRKMGEKVSATAPPSQWSSDSDHRVDGRRLGNSDVDEVRPACVGLLQSTSRIQQVNSHRCEVGM
jgi:hypothetical protein